MRAREAMRVWAWTHEVTPHPGVSVSVGMLGVAGKWTGRAIIYLTQCEVKRHDYPCGDQWGARIWSLWQMIQFIAGRLLNIGYVLGSEAGTAVLEMAPLNSGPLSQDQAEKLLVFLANVESETESLQLNASHNLTHTLISDISRLKSGLQQEQVSQSLRGIRTTLQYELSKMLFFEMAENAARFYKQERPFGDAAFDAFPSARFDISEAGTCLACGLNSATAFHLMRAAEVGLWELGRDRQIPIAQNGKIEFEEWGKIIRELEDAVKGIQQWANSREKEEAHKFYNSALVEIRAFNDGWRRHIAHVRCSQQPLQNDETIALWGHVSRFLGMLATKIGEGKYMPLVWS
jgi:hypothetical protein